MSFSRSLQQLYTRLVVNLIITLFEGINVDVKGSDGEKVLLHIKLLGLDEQVCIQLLSSKIISPLTTQDGFISSCIKLYSNLDLFLLK